MANLEQVTIELPELVAAEMRAAVEMGRYSSTDEIIQDALQLWSARQPDEKLPQARLRAAWDAGKASGLHGTPDVEELRREARERLAAVQGHAG